MLVTSDRYASTVTAAPALPAAGRVALCATRTRPSHCAVGPVPPLVIFMVNNPPSVVLMSTVPRVVAPAALLVAAATRVRAVLVAVVVVMPGGSRQRPAGRSARPTPVSAPAPRPAP